MAMDFRDYLCTEIGICEMPTSLTDSDSMSKAQTDSERADLFFRFWTRVMDKDGALTLIELATLARGICMRCSAYFTDDLTWLATAGSTADTELTITFNEAT